MPFIPIAATSLENTFTAKQTVLDNLRVGVPAGSALETALNAQLGAQSAIIGGDTQGWSEHFIGGTEGFWEPGQPYRGTQVTLGNVLTGGGWGPLCGFGAHVWLGEISSWFSHYRPNGTYFYPLTFNSTTTDEWAQFNTRVQMHNGLQVAPSAAQVAGLTATDRSAAFVSGQGNWSEIAVMASGIGAGRGAALVLGDTEGVDGRGTTHALIGTWKELGADPYMFLQVRANNENKNAARFGWDTTHSAPYTNLLGQLFVKPTNAFVLTSSANDAATFVSGDPGWTSLRVLGQGGIDVAGGSGLILARADGSATKWELAAYSGGLGTQPEFYIAGPNAAGNIGYYLWAGTNSAFPNDRYVWTYGHLEVEKTIRMGGWSITNLPGAHQRFTTEVKQTRQLISAYDDGNDAESYLILQTKTNAAPNKLAQVAAQIGNDDAPEAWANIGVSKYGANTEGWLDFSLGANGSVQRTLTVTPTAWAFAGTRIDLGATQILTTRRTGWEAPTGTATRTTFATANVTTANLAQRVKALIDDLMAHGIIGA
jgi:hypothetical protein